MVSVCMCVRTLWGTTDAGHVCGVLLANIALPFNRSMVIEHYLDLESIALLLSAIFFLFIVNHRKLSPTCQSLHP